MKETRLTVKPFKSIAILLALFYSLPSAEARLVRYELVATQEKVNLSGKKEVDFAIALNGTIPAPILEFTEGDDVEIMVKNRVPNQELSIHWHGLLLPPEEDGVSYVNTPPIHSGQEHTFRFKLRQHGTYWYHSHTGVQEQKGVYGAFIIHPKKKTIAYDRDAVVVISDWSDENADQILRNLRKDGDYYLYKKGTMRSWLGAIQAGGLGTYLSNEWTRMGGMDYSDVGYDAFLMNGKRESQLLAAHPGEKIRFRVINAGASSYFNLALGQEPMKVIAADGIDIEPVLAKEILVGMAETYDLLFEPKEHKNYELKATAQDGTGSASAWIGMGEKVPAPVKPFPAMYAPMDHGAHGGHAGHAVGAANVTADHSAHSGHSAHSAHGSHAAPAKRTETLRTVDTLTVDELKARESTVLPKNAQVHDVKLLLGGDMERYVWHINGKAMFEDRSIAVNEGDVIRFTFENQTMMHHPMHLHGHFFRVLNQNGERSPLKHTVDMAPHTTRTIEFYANEPGEWMLHCHNLYHMKTGMARTVKYSSFQPKAEIARIQNHDPHLHDHWYGYGTAEAATNHAQASYRLSQTWNQVDARFETRNTTGRNFSFRDPWEIEGDLLYRRWFGNFLNVAGGGTLFDKRASAMVGFSAILPMLVEVQAFVNHRGKFRLDLEKRFQWTKTVFTDVDFVWRPKQAHERSEDLEYEISLMYGPAWSWAAGLMLTDKSLGAGVQFQF
jgi:FtsP/CotA-like multicopper oxidase with cupredoxin domain